MWLHKPRSLSAHSYDWASEVNSRLITKWPNEGLEFYTLNPTGKRNDEIKACYINNPINEIINWKKQVICSAPSSKERRESIKVLSDVICTEEYIKKNDKSKHRCANDKKRLEAREIAAIKCRSQNKPNAKRRLVENYRCEAGIACSEQKASKKDHKSINKHSEDLKSGNEDLRKQCNSISRKMKEKKNCRWPTWKKHLNDVIQKEQKLEVQLRQLRAQLGQIQFTYAKKILSVPRPNTHTQAFSVTRCGLLRMTSQMQIREQPTTLLNTRIRLKH